MTYAAPEVIQGVSYAAIAPPLIVAIAAVVVLVADAFGLPRRLLGLLTGASLLAALGAVIAQAMSDPRATFCAPAKLRASTGSDALDGSGQAALQWTRTSEAYAAPLDEPPTWCSYVADDFTLLFQGVVLAAAVIVVLLSLGEIRRSAIPAGEFHALLLAAITGALTLVAGRDLITLIVALEMLTLPVFALVALRRYDGRASEAALKLFLVSVVSAAVTLFGISLVYGVTGAMHLSQVASALDRAPDDLEPVAALGVVLVIAGFAFKVAAVPFHFWAPDVYQGAPLPVTIFLSVVSKAAGFAALILILAVGFPSYASTWGPVIGVMAAVTMTVGNLIALRQRHAVRLLAWSSVAQSGYMLAPLAVAAHDASEKEMETAVAATVAYVALYAVMNIGAFSVVVAVDRHVRGGGTVLNDYRGMARTNPATAVAMAFFLLCLAGLPPGLMGLFAKIAVFRAAVDGAATWLAVIMAVNTVIGLYYYLSWAARLFAPGDVSQPRVIRPGWSVGLAIAAATLGAIALSAVPQIVLHVTPLSLPGS